MSVIDRINLIFDKPKLSDFYMSFTQMQTLLDSGLPTHQVLELVAEAQRNQQLKNAFYRISLYIKAGDSVGAAFKRYEHIFPKDVAPTLAAGERSGRLPEAFLKLADLMWMRHNLYSKVANALFIPKIAAVLMVIMTIAYIKLALPDFVKLYKETDIEVPAVIEIVSGVVNGIVDNWPITLLSLLLVYKAWKWFTGRHMLLVDTLKLHMPIYKDLHFNFIQHQFASIMELTLANGMTTPAALLQTADTVESYVMARDISRVHSLVLAGMTLGESVRKCDSGAFDPMLIAGVSAGERASQLVTTLGKCRLYYERVIENLVDTISTKITLAVMIPMGVLIVLMFAFTLVPIFSYIDKATAGV